MTDPLTPLKVLQDLTKQELDAAAADEEEEQGVGR